MDIFVMSLAQLEFFARRGTCLVIEVVVELHPIKFVKRTRF